MEKKFYDFESAEVFFKSAPKYQQKNGRVKVANNTWLQVEVAGEDRNLATSYALVFYGYKIVRYSIGGSIWLQYDEGYSGSFSATTARRMTDYTPFTIRRTGSDVWVETQCQVAHLSGKFGFKMRRNMTDVYWLGLTPSGFMTDGSIREWNASSIEADKQLRGMIPTVA